MDGGGRVVTATILEHEAGQHPRIPAAGHHRDVNGGWLRPAVFGAMDGLVSNFALMTGVVGGAVPSSTVVLTGLAGLAAGACSMAAGEYTSVASQRELVQAEIEAERLELSRNPHGELAELAQVYIDRGVEPELAHEVARQLSADPDRTLEVHAREELGVDPNDLPSPWVAAGSSFVCFAVGALLPLLPYLLGATSLVPALLLSAAGLFACGAVVARVTARSWWFSGLRQLLLGGAAAGVTYLLGWLIGGQIG
ncbi:VIT1/CCC1 transporter family protein [Kitasatospora purpeofusca]|uniref:VIT1/CCC1 transporter family protein n=1 Tax=Kitasatospora purpeofusca TaxID=67352 RepID=UPI0039A6BAF2